MAGNARRIVVEFIGDDKSLTSTARKVEGTTGKLGGKLGKVGLIAGGVLATGALAAAKGLYEAGQAAMEDQASATKLATALKNTTGATDKQVASVEKWISAQGKTLGVTDDQLRPALQKLVTATGDVAKGQKLASLAMDVSAGTGKSLESVSQALARAQNGNTQGLGRLGIATKDAAGKALSFEQIQKNLAKTFKGQAAAGANTLQGRIARLKLQFDETVEAIGYKLLPVAEKFVGWIVDKAIPGVSRFAKMLQTKFGPVFAKVSGFLKKFTKDGEASTGKFGKTIGQLKSIFSSLVSIVKSVVSIVQSLWKRFGSTILKHTEGTFKNVISAVSGALKIIAGVFKVIASVLKGDWKGAWDGIKQIVSGAWQVIKAVVSQGWNSIKALFSIGVAALKGIFTGLWNALKSLTSAAWSGIKSLVSSGWNSIKSAFSSAGSALKSTFAATWNGIKDAARSGFDFIVNGVKAIPGKIAALGSKFLSVGKDLMGKFLDGLSRVGGLAGDFAKGVWEAVKRLINTGIDKINAALEFTINMPSPIPNVRVNPKNIPHLYRGGIVKGSKEGTLAVLGDRRHDEAVVPLSGPHAPSFGGGGDIHITLTLDSEIVHRALVRRKRNLGRELGLA